MESNFFYIYYSNFRIVIIFLKNLKIPRTRYWFVFEMFCTFDMGD